MNERRYRAVRGWFLARPAALRALKAANRLLPVLAGLCYLALLGGLALLRDERLFRAAGVPAAAFVLGSALRAVLNRPRPYEVYGLAPLVSKETKGRSFPSRHLLSAAVLAAAGWWVSPPLGLILTITALLLVPARVLAGVHFVRDVAAGAALGALFGWLGFWGLG